MRRRNSLWPTFSTLASVLGVAFGVAAFLVVVTVFNSFEGELRRILLSANPHLVVYNFPAGIPDARTVASELRAAIRQPVAEASLFEYSEGILSRGMRTATVVLRGIEGDRSSNAKDLAAVVTPANAIALLDQPSQLPLEAGAVPAILGGGLALKLGVKPGDRVSLTTAGIDGTERAADLQVAGLFWFGLAGYDERLAFLGFNDAVRLFGKPGFARGVEFRLEDPELALQASFDLQGKTPYLVRPWQDIDKGLFMQIERDGTSIRVIVAIITLVAAFNILTSLSLNVVDRSRQIALLRAIGASRTLIVRVFVTMGFVFGVVGAGLGVGLGLVVLRLFQGFDLGELKATYFLSKIPVDYDWMLVLQALGVALLIALVSSLYPAWRATRVSPLQGMRPGYN
jgi:lipoprotein-releasing system permease protein